MRCRWFFMAVTGIPDDMIKKAINLGVAKINVNTECQLSFAAATRKYIEEGKDLQGKGYDPRKLLAPVLKRSKKLSERRLSYLVLQARHLNKINDT